MSNIGLEHTASSINSDLPTDTGLPLCIDLDGTLTMSDTLVEGLLSLLGRRAMFGAVAALAREGRVGLKRHVAASAPVDAAHLPYCHDLLRYIAAERATGRLIVLVTAANRAVAQAVAAHIGLFDEVMASDGNVNLKGEAKARMLVQRFGQRGFVYAGNDKVDLAIWREAAAAILVNVPRRVAIAARGICPIEAEFGEQGRGWLGGLVHGMRPHQWSKNLLVFIPLFTAHLLGSAAAWLTVCATFVAFCATASAIYIINDLTDLPADRRHHRKRNRPFASGAVSVQVGVLAAIFLLATGLALAALSGTLGVLAAYAAISTAYSLKLKEFPLVDIFVLAALYTIRMFGGAAAIGHSLSLWLLAFSSFFFLSLALVKRVEELRVAAERGSGVVARRGYMPSDAGVLQTFGVAAAFCATLVLALFVQSEATGQRYSAPALIWVTVPLVLFWQTRIWLSAARGYMHDDPIIYAARDWVSWLVAFAAVVTLTAAKSLTWTVT